MVDPARIRHLISTIEVNEEESVRSKIYIDFYDGKGQPRWYLLYSVRQRTFNAVRLGPMGRGAADLPARLRRYLVSIIPPAIIARCTAASLGAATKSGNHAQEETMTIDAATVHLHAGAVTPSFTGAPPDDTLPTRAAERFANRETFAYAQVEGALCVYEWMLGARENINLIEGWWDTLGSPGMRMASIQAGDICDRAYKHMESIGYEFTDAYDFEFVPAVCGMIDWNALCNDNQYDRGRYDPDIHAMVVTMIAADRARCCDPMRRSFQRTDKASPTPEQFVARCCAEAELQWGYAGLVSDHMERVQEAMKADEDPAEFIEWLGQKYDLTPRAPATGG